MMLGRSGSLGYRHPFLIGSGYIGGVGDIPRTLIDLAMSHMSAELRRRPLWYKEYADTNNRTKWASKALEQMWSVRIPSGHAHFRLSPKQVDYVLDELAGYDALRDERNRCQVSCFERIWESDALLNEDTVSKLKNEIDSLRTSLHSSQERAFLIAKSQYGFVPLIDPYFYPLIFGQTVLNYLNQHSPLSPPAAAEACPVTSRQYAFLPSDVSISPTSPGTAEFCSYINNLDPASHAPLYKSLSTLFAAFLPLFEHTLTDLHRNNPLPRRISGSHRYAEWDEPDEPEYSDDEDAWIAYERAIRTWVLNRPIVLPDVPNNGYRGGLEQRRHFVSLRGKKVQVIVGVSEIHLDPGRPTHPQAPWHVEGMSNERIVACGFYYLSITNLSPCSIEFRMAVSTPRGFEVGDVGATKRIWGFEDNDPCHQYIGSVPIRPGFGLVFPNIYQYQHTPFTLADPREEGHLSIVSFLLVDPEVIPVISTSSVAPQQKEWIARAVDNVLDARLPFEIVERIISQIDGLMDNDEAEQVRQRMLEERESFWKYNDRHYFCLPFNALESGF